MTSRRSAPSSPPSTDRCHALGHEPTSAVREVDQAASPERLGHNGRVSDETLGLMSGDNYYQEHSATQRDTSELGLSFIDEALADLGESPDRPLIADFGVAQGRNSARPISRALAHFSDDVEVVVVHSDLPGNDWHSLFGFVSDDPQSYLRGRDNVRVFVAGTSFYNRILPKECLALGWTSAAVHWLSESPGKITDNFFVQSSTDTRAQTAYREQSRADWQAFLRNRAVELRPRGSIVFVDVLMGDDGLMGSEKLFASVETSLRWALTAGIIATSEYEGIAYPTWFRSLDEFREPFPFMGPEGSSLDLVSLTPVQLADPFKSDFERSGDRDAYAQQQVGFLRGFLEPSFTTALVDNDPSRLEPIWDHARDLISVDPGAVSPTYRLVCGRIRRNSADND